MNASSRVGALALTVVLSLGVAGCGDPTGIEGAGVRFVLSSAPSAALVGDQVSGAQAETGSDVSSTFPATAYDHRDDDDRDRPRGPFFVSANVTLSSILARNFDGVLVDVDMDLPVTVDVMRMETGREITLPDGDLPPGMYDQIVVVMTAVQGMTEDGTTVTIEPPGGGWTAVIPVCPFDVAEGSTTVVGLQLAVHRSFSWKNNRFHFDPRFECETPEPLPEG
jgi:hypothetical protein